MVINDFLPLDLRDRLWLHTLAHEGAFVDTEVYAEAEARSATDIRRSLHCPDGLGALKKLFKCSIEARTDDILSALGIMTFSPSKMELQLSAHGHLGFYRPHVDTIRASIRQPSDRIVTIVYYLHSRPKRFTGGELAIFPLGGGAPVVVEPIDNRLIAFPSFARHEVRTVQCEDPSDFSQFRFSVNCWIHRTR
ncbi:MAG: 2OG-Fe(II) oxygenase [Hyphomonadaceae bacterium]|nr:2OG-Fe(II) oxygenase [Hyphomonadaceae bacterium]